MAELEPARYFNLSIQKLDEISAWLKEAGGPCQPMLVHIDILLLLSRGYPVVANLRIKQASVSDWQETFNDWFNRCKSKIPKKHRSGIKESAESLFLELENYGH